MKLKRMYVLGRVFMYTLSASLLLKLAGVAPDNWCYLVAFYGAVVTGGIAAFLFSLMWLSMSFSAWRRDSVGLGKSLYLNFFFALMIFALE